MNVVNPTNVTARATVVAGAEVAEKGVTMETESIMVVEEEMAAVVMVGAARQKKMLSEK